jgi:hypothetical protein
MCDTLDAKPRDMQPTTATDDVLSGDINYVVKQLGKGGGLQDPRARLRERLSDELAKLPPHFEPAEQDRLATELRDLETPLVTHLQGGAAVHCEASPAANVQTAGRILD